jgi:hypothetical protein
VIIAGLMLVVGAEVAATISPTAASAPKPRRSETLPARKAPQPYRGEPRIPASATAPADPRAAAVRFVHDYVLWSDGQLGKLPATDATQRVIRLLERQPRGTRLLVGDAVDSVRIRSTGHDQYIVTSALGNFLIATRRSRWLVVSLPGD